MTNDVENVVISWIDNMKTISYSNVASIRSSKLVPHIKICITCNNQQRFGSVWECQNRTGLKPNHLNFLKLKPNRTMKPFKPNRYKKSKPLNHVKTGFAKKQKQKKQCLELCTCDKVKLYHMDIIVLGFRFGVWVRMLMLNKLNQ